MVFDLKKIETPASLSEIAYETIKENLLKMDLSTVESEECIDERGLAEKLGISRTPLREAISRLVVEGFLKVVPRRGIFVVKKSKAEIVEILLVRSALEGLAARLAAINVSEEDIIRMKQIFLPFDASNIKRQFLKYSNANIKFHELVLRLSGCKTLIESAGNIFDHMRWIRFQTVVFEQRLINSHREHLEIIEALEKKAQELAENRMRAHIESLASYVEMDKNVKGSELPTELLKEG